MCKQTDTARHRDTRQQNSVYGNHGILDTACAVSYGTITAQQAFTANSRLLLERTPSRHGQTPDTKTDTDKQ